jgi:hypothetical protein
MIKKIPVLRATISSKINSDINIAETDISKLFESLGYNLFLIERKYHIRTKKSILFNVTIQFLEVNAVHDRMSLREVAEGHRTGE